MSDQRREAKHGATGEWWKLGGPASVLILLGFGLAYLFVDPSPPGSIAMATGEPGGAYDRHGAAYSERLAEFEIEVVLSASAGSEESLARLEEGEVDVAFVQGGVATDRARESLESLGSLYYEPLWLFHRRAMEVGDLGDLAGRRVAIGPPGSGTRAIATELLARNAVEGEFVEATVAASTGALLAGELDAAFLIASPESAHVHRLLLSEQIELHSFRRAAAYARTHRFLSPVTLPEGMIDYARNVPDRDIALLSPTATLVVRRDLHPALVDLLVQSAEAIHGSGGVFERPGEFPTPDYIDLPLNPEARRFYVHGAPFLQRYLPFWLATLVDRLKVMLIPLVALLIPVFRLFPPIYRWRVRSRIYRWYKELGQLDPRGREGLTLADAIEDAERIEDEIAEVEAPASYAQELYDLRLHLEFMKRSLAEQAERPKESASPVDS